MSDAVFISLYDESAYGLRILSACLKNAGHNCSIIFLKNYHTGLSSKRAKLYEGEVPWEGIGPYGEPFIYAISRGITGTEKKLLIRLIADLHPDFIGLTVNTPLKWRARSISRILKAHFPETPLLWGGFEPTLNPRESLQYCDYACRGEAEQTVIEFADTLDKGGDLKSIPNLCHKAGPDFFCNDLHPPERNLDSLPFQDTDLSGKYLIENNCVVENPGLLFSGKHVYSTISSRGCIFQCSYCCEYYMKNLYKPHPFLRRRSPENLIEELEHVISRHEIHYVIFQDEIFSFQKDWLHHFVDLYREKIALPFTAYLFPSRDFDERVELLKRAGLSQTCLAVQTGSENICRNFNRNFNRNMFFDAARVLKEKKVPFYTDVITYNPCEKKEDLEMTLDVLLKLPHPYELCINKLYVLPGTELNDTLSGMTIDEGQERMFRYYSSLFWIASYFDLSKGLVRLIQKAGIFEKYPQALKPLLVSIRAIAKAVSLVDNTLTGIREGKYKIPAPADLLHRKTGHRKEGPAKTTG